MKVRIKRWADSAAVLIPGSVMAATALALDQAVEVREEGGRISIEPIRPPTSDLDQLLDQMTPDSFHEEVDFEPAVGDEA
jgi:antitoxin MazE